MACRFAMCPTRRLPASVTATIDGVVLYPPRLGITVGTPFSTIATHELVVPRSMPITFSIRRDLLHVTSRHVGARARANADGHVDLPTRLSVAWMVTSCG